MSAGDSNFGRPLLGKFLQRGRIACNALQSAVIATAIPSFRPSVFTRWYPIQTNEVRIMRSLPWSSKNILVFSHQQWLRGDVAFHLKFALKVTHPPSEKRRLRPISAYNISTVRPSEKVQLSRIESRPRAFQRAIYEVLMLPQSSPKGGSKSKFVIFVNKNKFKSNKLYYKVSLCENFQRQTYSRPIPLSNDLYMLAVNITLEPNI